MIKWHINLKERRGTMEKENSVLPKPLSKHKGKICLKEKQKLSRNYATLASTSRKHYKLVTDTLPVIEIRGFHCLCGLNKIYPGFLMIPLNLATSTG